MWIGTQFSVFMVNKPGVLARVLGEVAKAKINILALTVMDSAEHGVMRVVFDAAEKARAILSSLNMPFNETEVLCITLDNRSGALATVMERLAKAHINVCYAYCTAGARGGRTTGVIKVPDVKKAMRVLNQAQRRLEKDSPAIRLPNAKRR